MTENQEEPTRRTGHIHHVEITTLDMAVCVGVWDWLLRNLGYVDGQIWDGGHEWVLDGTSVILSVARMEGIYDRRRPGLSHLAFHAGSRSQVDRLWNEGPAHGWTHLYEDRHPFAGGADWYAAYMENTERFKIELVADDWPETSWSDVA